MSQLLNHEMLAKKLGMSEEQMLKSSIMNKPEFPQVVFCSSNSNIWLWRERDIDVWIDALKTPIDIEDVPSI